MMRAAINPDHLERQFLSLSTTAIATSPYVAHVVLASIVLPASALINPHLGEVKMASFETTFRIPSSHILKARFHSYGGGIPESWSHEEYSDKGEFIARYESRMHINDDGIQTSDGWMKFDFDDVLVASENGLPI